MCHRLEYRLHEGRHPQVPASLCKQILLEMSLLLTHRAVRCMQFAIAKGRKTAVIGIKLVRRILRPIGNIRGFVAE